MSSDAARERLKALLLERSIREGDFTLASGGKSRFFVDVKATAMQAEGASLVGTLMLEAVEALSPRPVAVGGLETGAIPIVQSIVVASHAASTPIDGFFVRKQAKGTGPQTQLEGVIEAGTHVVLVEDVTTQGKSALKAVDVVRALGCTVDTLLTVVDRKRGAEATLAEHGIRLVPVLSADQLGIAE